MIPLRRDAMCKGREGRVWFCFCNCAECFNFLYPFCDFLVNEVVPIAPPRYCLPSVEMLISVPWNIVPAIPTASGLLTMSVFDPFGK